MPKWRSVKIYVVMEEDYENSAPVAAFRNKRRAAQECATRQSAKISKLVAEGKYFPWRPTGFHIHEVDLLEEHFL